MRDVKWTRCGVLALCLLTARGALAEGQSLRIQQPTLVARATPEHPFDEPHLTVDPRDGNHWLAATIVRGSAPTFPEVLRDQTCASFVSADGGKTWDRHDFPVTACADPSVVLTDDGQAIAYGSDGALTSGRAVQAERGAVTAPTVAVP